MQHDHVHVLVCLISNFATYKESYKPNIVGDSLLLPVMSYENYCYIVL